MIYKPPSILRKPTIFGNIHLFCCFLIHCFSCEDLTNQHLVLWGGTNFQKRYTSEELIVLFSNFARNGQMDFRCFTKRLVSDVQNWKVDESSV